MGKIILGLLAISFWGGVVYGYVMNIVHLVQSEVVWTSGMSIGRIVGIFVAPLGVVLGYF